jgi:sulfite exporter TauE/SafE
VIAPAAARGLLLGLSSGTVCLAACAPVAVPYFLAENRDVRDSYSRLALFLGGRLAGYLAFGAVAWGIGLLLPRDAYRLDRLTGVVYLVLGALLALYGLAAPRRELCAARGAARLLTGPLDDARAGRLAGRLVPRGPALPALFGLLSGLNLCPPFLLALGDAATTGGLGQSLTYFAAFFAGTSVWVSPLPLLGALRGRAQAQLVGRLTAVAVGVFFVVTGVVRLLR